MNMGMTECRGDTRILELWDLAMGAARGDNSFVLYGGLVAIVSIRWEDLIDW
jgi:hypothetical protein